MKYTLADLFPILPIIIILAFALTDAISVYHIGGVNWDFIAEILYAKAILAPNFYLALFKGNLNAVINYGNKFYFETIRPPLIGVLMIPFILLGGDTFVPLYLTFTLMMLLLSVFYLSKILETDPLLLTLLFFTPYVIFYFLMLNGAEIVSMCFVLVSIGLILKRRWDSGIMLAIAGLAKYDSLIFLLLLPLLPEKVRTKAFASFVLTTMPWLIFNTIVFHNPIYSYLSSIHAFNADAQGVFNVGLIFESLRLALPDLIPAFIIFALLVLFRYLNNRKNLRKTATQIFALDYRYRVVFATLIIGLFGWLLTAISGSINDLPREAYLIYFGIALLLGILITDLSNVKIKLPFNKPIYVYASAVLFIVSLGMLLSAHNSLYTNYVFGPYGSANPSLRNVSNALQTKGLINCSVVSNNWVYLDYVGVRAHFPYYYNATVQGYPIVYFTNMGSNSTPINFDNVTTRLNYTNFYIAFPKNWKCVN